MRYVLCTVAFSATALAVPVLLVPPNMTHLEVLWGTKLSPPFIPTTLTWRYGHSVQLYNGWDKSAKRLVSADR
ncbi:hypothetical protein BDV33DRAFT_184856 [Aspergillus novoparasiticus]|uniref:Uncharacterized protein n=1 Tax=Aspergillus novoparasiticus TaxID=986946 RepID=A0A5N6E7S1_9EURO|nr:hypothetical protein BDV33DRAFT_184856 [Aspergillus novoparasiticus]